MRRRLKLVAAPARSQSEPDSGCHCVGMLATQGPPSVFPHPYSGCVTVRAPIPLIDPFARRVKDLRVSITDRCNFRCAYCMPEEGMQWLPREELLTYEEIARVARVCVERFGFEAVRLTGGEP